MKITYTQYINNPLGQRNSVITNRGMYQKMYRDKLDKILLREGGRVKYKLYKGKDEYYIHFKIPSEVINKFYYDTIIEFYTDKPLVEKSPSLRDYYVRFYSNDPAFCYTFGHAFIQNEIFVKDLLPKMMTDVKKKVAKEKNPENLVGYVKSLFFAYLLIGDYGLFSKTLYDINGESYNKNKLLSNVEHAKDKVRKRQEEEEKERKQRARKKENENRFKTEISTKSSKSSSMIKNVRTTQRVKKIGVTNKTKRI